VLITITAILGLVFMLLQWFGFSYLEEHGVQIIGSGSNPAASFIGVITGVHMLHVLGGVVALLIMFFKAFSSRRKSYSGVPIDMMNIYWHFVDGLWIYLFIFFLYVSS
jgi:cytochrome c oxidase subunit 3